jgi:hypothetical protein
VRRRSGRQDGAVPLLPASVAAARWYCPPTYETGSNGFLQLKRPVIPADEKAAQQHRSKHR